jgi:hypothetical protein
VGARAGRRDGGVDPGSREAGLQFLGELGLVLAGEAVRIEPTLALEAGGPDARVHEDGGGDQEIRVVLPPPLP